MDAMKSRCNACGTEGPTRAWDYCQACIDRHQAGELPLGSCEGCDQLDYESEKEEQGGDPDPGA